MSEEIRPDLRKVSIEDIYYEIGRRKLKEKDLIKGLNLKSDRPWHLFRYEVDFPTRMKYVAVWVLTIFGAGLLILIGYLAISVKEIPNLVAGLAGSTIGAIVGILSAGQGSSAPASEAKGGASSTTP